MRKKMKKIAVTALAGTMALSTLAMPAANISAATEHWNDASAAWTEFKAQWDTTSKDYEHVSLTPGVNETQINLAWYSHTEETPKVKLSTKADMTNAVEFTGTQISINETVEGYYSNKAVVTDLKENTKYYYQLFKNGEWTEAEEYKTQSFSSYSILYVGDPQIGACTKQTSAEGEVMSESGANLAARNDSFNWNNVLNQATLLHDVSFIISAGDQVNTATSEEEYAGYLGADALSSLPVATTIGNHDSKSIQYSYHYNNPNTFASDDEKYAANKTAAGTDYYYTYGDVLFIVLDTNNYNCATHENVIKKAIEENKDAKWRVVTFHQDIYGSGYDHSDSDGIVLRTQLTPIFDKYDIDVVLQGHDHTYSRTFQLSGDGKEHTAYNSTSQMDYNKTDSDEVKQAASFYQQNQCYSVVDKTAGTVVDPKGIVYFEANSATGSKFYNLIATQQDYIAERAQSWTPNYSVLNVTENALTVTTYDAATGKVLNSSESYTIVKEADKASLKTDIETANKLVAEASKYTDETVATLKSAIAAAQVVVNDKTATEAQVAEVASALSKAIGGIQNKEVVNPAATPSTADAVSVKSVKATGKKAVKVTWKKSANATGYQIKYGTNKKVTKKVKTVTIKSSKTTSKKIKGLKTKTKYYVKMRAYITVNGKKVYTKYSKAKKVVTK